MSSSDNDSNNDIWDNYKMWYYTPSVVAAAIFCAIFALLTIAHTWRLIKSRTWFCIPFLVGAIFETIGYGARAAASKNTESVGIYVIQSVLILISPALFAASIYMVLGRLIRACRAESYSIVRVNWLTKLFVSGDVLCFLMQSAGGGLIAGANSQSSLRTAENIILAGLILQIVIFGVFVVVGIIFHQRLHARPTAASLDGGLPWQRLMAMLYLVSVLIAVRNIIRVVEYAAGNTGYLLTHEWTLYVFDALLMAAALAICLMWYISSIRPKILREITTMSTATVEIQDQFGSKHKTSAV